MKKVTLLATFAFGLFIASCGGDDTQKAETKEAQDKAKATEKSVKYTVNADESTINWEGSKTLVDSKHYGTVDLNQGTFTVKGDNIESGNFVIDMTSIKNEDLEDEEKNQKLVGHLKSDDFFSVEDHPNATFEITQIEAIKKQKEGDDSTHKISGNLTIKGISKNISFNAKVHLSGDDLHLAAKFKIDRSNWDVRFGSTSFFDDLGDKAISDDIKLEVEVHASK